LPSPGDPAGGEFGVAFAGVTNSHHFGVAAYHLEPVGASGLVGLAMGNSPAAMAAAGGRRPLFGTNPIAAVFPRRAAAPLVIDLSLSEVARGKLMVAAREGKAIPPGWALDADGHPTTDPKVGLEGRGPNRLHRSEPTGGLDHPGDGRWHH
jgi:(2R)-3-sulfolactate dehydrogenase (NADP+)